MKAVGVRELKNRLSAYLGEVAAGEVVLVTDRGRVVAELRRPTVEGLQSPAEQALGRLVAAGVLTIGLPQDPGSLLEEAAGLAGHKSAPARHHDLDALAGTWTREEAKEFDRALRAQRPVDPDLWR